jgi:hypothetical protein
LFIPETLDKAPKLPWDRSWISRSVVKTAYRSGAGQHQYLRVLGRNICGRVVCVARPCRGATLTLSPSFTYNQVSHDQWCGRGKSILATLNLLT